MGQPPDDFFVFHCESFSGEDGGAGLTASFADSSAGEALFSSSSSSGKGLG
jgi:hypothetical protein